MPDNPNDLYHEPPIDPIADTNPSLSMKPVPFEQPVAAWRRGVGLLSLIGAAALTIGTALLLLTPDESPSLPTVPPTADAAQTELTLAPTETSPPTQTPLPQPLPEGVIPTISPEMAAALLSQPLTSLHPDTTLRFVRDLYDPFTIVPDRPRNEVIRYTAQRGDTIYSIAERFGLKPETIGWSNPRRIVLVLRPGDVLNIPPVDGVYVQVMGSRTIAEIAAQYKVTDPFIVIDSEFNALAGKTPDTILPSGTYIFIPGGQGEQIAWTPGVTVEQGDSPRRGFVSSFATGDPGSCGNVNNPGGGASWGFPLSGAYTFIRGFSAWHTGVDLAAPPGTPVLAANSGAVIFAGWNSWGYGYTVVLAHGPFLTLYGHMSAINVRCGQLVSVGQVVGAVGSTGNSSGPHLHFEIRNGDTPTDPTATMRF